MKSVGDIIHTDPVWVNPNHVVGTALLLMRGHNVCGLPVMEGNALVGMLHYENLVGADLHRRVGEVMWYQVTALPIRLPLREAADTMVREGVNCLPVVDEQGAIKGLITSVQLLSELRRSLDPLTELPWSDSLREWGINALRSGKEITILFADINDFGLFNKQFGHVVGDSVLHSVARVMSQALQLDREIICRFGGDEFCIASLRRAGEADLLAESLKRQVADIALSEMQGETIRISVGVWGGKRTLEREQIHYAATLNNLINLASRSCIAQKSAMQTYSQNGSSVRMPQSLQHLPADERVGGQPSPITLSREDPDWQSQSELNTGDENRSQITRELVTIPLVNPLIRLSRIDVEWEDKVAHVSVELDCRTLAKSFDAFRGTARSAYRIASGALTANGQMVGSLMTREIEPEALMKLIADATLAAMLRVMPDSVTVCMDEVRLSRNDAGNQAVTVIVYGITESGRRSFTGTSLLEEDVPHTVANAVISACLPLLTEVTSSG